ncbi:ammonium transporter 1 member 3-like [Protopterus annectens]|uniref:ammonium transporter 1 member 3-like n=1 Tax=Protopterus annectens TaxID=7888 RepID=UPI001CFAAFCE|nr:ammonium transporter 1 member 3-like [Protopterus annectens]
MATVVSSEAINDAFVVFCGILVIFFKFGFTFFATGKTAELSSANVLFLSVADSFISLFAYWLHGYAFAFGDGYRFIGAKYFLTLNNPKFSHFFFNYARCAVATSLVMGAIVERAEPVGYLVSSYLLSGFVLPVASHWFWHPQGHFYLHGSAYPVQDSAGSGVVFGVGATAAMCACFIIGKRSNVGPKLPRQGHSLPFTVLGACIQMISFLGFTIGAHGYFIAEGDGQITGLTAVNTLLAGSSAGLYGMLYQRLRKQKYSVQMLIDSSLAGMVAVCAGASSYFPGLSLFCGATSALVFTAVQQLIIKLKYDDPVNVIPSK